MACKKSKAHDPDQQIIALIFDCMATSCFAKSYYFLLYSWSK
ncbi:hypothetical protein CUZ91_2636 [Enterococcus xinjiangensis]|nr:hypothetical protein [Enterococcus lactis]